MNYIKILLFLFSASLLQDLSNANKPNKPWQPNTRRMNSSPDGQNCICFPDGDIPIVQQLLDPNDNGLQRIVIYLYINDKTNEIKMYTPSAEKQMLIPDLIYEPTDGLVNITPDNIYSLINGSPSKIKVYNNRYEALDPQLSHSLPIGLNVGAIEHVLRPITDDIYLNPLNNNNGNEYALDGSVPISNAQLTAHPNYPQDGVNVYPENTNIYFPTEDNTYSPESTQHWISDSTNYPNGQGQALPEQSSSGYAQAVVSPSPGYPQAYPTNSQGLPENTQLITGYAQAYLTNSENIPENIQISINKPVAYPTNSQGYPEGAQSLTGYAQAYLTNPENTPDNIQSSIINLQAYPSISQDTPGDNVQYSTVYLQASPGISQGILENIQSLPGSHQVYPSNSQDILESIQSSTGQLQAIPGILEKPGQWDLQPLSETLEAKPLNGDLDQYVVYTLQKSRDQKSPQGLKELKKPNYYVTFEVWFNQQMKRFHYINLPNDIQSVDGKFLRQLVLKTFSDNKIFINEDGIITDSKGTLIDASNLELRPLLIGEKIDQRILEKYQKPIILPKDLPYLEGILVAFIYPPRILGIIPLGKTYLLEKSHDSPLMSGLSINSYGNKNPVSNLASSKPYSLIVKASYTVPMRKDTNSVDYNTYVVGKDQPIPLNLRAAVSSKALATAQPTILIEGPGVQTPPSIRRTHSQNTGLIKTHTELKNDLDINIPESLANANATESGRRFPSLSLQDVMKSLLNLIDILPSRRDLNDSSEETDSAEDTESGDEREGPKFRIIGGTAATGSGSPVSNKGRSGYTESI
ncbi:uncharacterized protein LOC124635959 [Helicoverpa zea]|uniref:uncharacterized protein LOC124635959 n=1 Tax=Helicoverpa zea TaxID=7113 RepID=UPI001F5AA2DD|nr:uncharacterized protein LOC124635959 [Helicoverpa zea]